MKYDFVWENGRIATGRFSSYRGLRQALAAYREVPHQISMALEDALAIGLVSPTPERRASTCIAGAVYELILHEASPAALLGKTGGRKRGAAKRRGNSDYYRQLVGKRARR